MLFFGSSKIRIQRSYCKARFLADSNQIYQRHAFSLQKIFHNYPSPNFNANFFEVSKSEYNEVNAKQDLYHIPIKLSDACVVPLEEFSDLSKS